MTVRSQRRKWLTIEGIPGIVVEIRYHDFVVLARREIKVVA